MSQHYPHDPHHRQQRCKCHVPANGHRFDADQLECVCGTTWMAHQQSREPCIYVGLKLNMPAEDAE